MRSTFPSENVGIYTRNKQTRSAYALRFSMPLQIQDRDISILQEIAACRFLSMNQIADLCFGGNREAARKRLQKLVRAGILDAMRIGMRSSVFQMTSRVSALRPIRKEFGQTRQKTAISFASIDHELAIRDFRAALIRDAMKNRIVVYEFSIESHQLAFKVNGFVIRPDGFFQVGLDDRAFRFFFEVDTGAEPLHVLSKRLCGDRSYNRSKTHRLHRKSLHQNSAFRVLFIFKTERRCNSALKYFRDAGFNHFVLCSTWEKAFARPWDSRWSFPTGTAGNPEPHLIA